MEAVPSMTVITRILEKSQTNLAPEWSKAQSTVKEPSIIDHAIGGLVCAKS